jgi:uncharacterized protein
VGCRSKAPQADLERFVAVAGQLTHDAQRRLPGRGAWLHPDEACWKLATERRAFARALRTRIDSMETSWRRNA